MAAGSTYTPISSQVLTSDLSSVTFSSIPQTYTDLVLVCSAQCGSGATSTNGDYRLFLNYNGDAGANYSHTRVYNSNGAMAYQQQTGRSEVDYASHMPAYGSGEFSTITFNIFNYANSSTYKTTLQKGAVFTNATYTEIGLDVNLWRSTSNITTIAITPGGNATTFATKSTFSLYGIASA